MFQDSLGNEFARPPALQKIGDKAIKIHQGPVFDVYQWEQKMFDGSVETFERIKEKDGVIGIAITRAKKILLLNEEQPGRSLYLGFPAGGVEIGEDPVSAIERELFEETGYVAREVIFWKGRQLNPVSDRAFYTFILRDCIFEGGKLLDGGEKISISEVTLEELLQILLQDERFLHKDIGFDLLRVAYQDPTLADLKLLLFGPEKG